jgi:hypothetical protein
MLSIWSTGFPKIIVRKKITAQEIEEAWLEMTSAPMPDIRCALECICLDELKRHHAWTIRRQKMLKAGAFAKGWVK